MVLFVITIPVGLLMIIGFKRVLSSTDEEMSCISKYSSRREKYVQKRIVVRVSAFVLVLTTIYCLIIGKGFKAHVYHVK